MLMRHTSLCLEDLVSFSLSLYAHSNNSELKCTEHTGRKITYCRLMWLEAKMGSIANKQPPTATIFSIKNTAVNLTKYSALVRKHLNINKIKP